MAADDAAEREPGEMELRRRRQDDVDSGRYLVGEAVDREGQCGLIGVAHARNVAGDHHIPGGQRFDSPDPMGPGAEAAMPPYNRFAFAPTPPDPSSGPRG